MTRCLGCAVVRHGFTHSRVARSPTLAWGRLSRFLALPSSNGVQVQFPRPQMRWGLHALSLDIALSHDRYGLPHAAVC